MKSAGKARNNGLYRHIRTSKEIIRNLLNDYTKFQKTNSVITERQRWQRYVSNRYRCDKQRPGQRRSAGHSRWHTLRCAKRHRSYLHRNHYQTGGYYEQFGKSRRSNEIKGSDFL